MTRPFQILFHLLRTFSRPLGGVHSTIARFLPLFLVIFSLPLFSHAQISQPYRFEQEQGTSSDAFNLISLKQEGLALVWDKEQYKEGKKIWKVILLDTTLKE